MATDALLLDAYDAGQPVRGQKAKAVREVMAALRRQENFRREDSQWPERLVARLNSALKAREAREAKAQATAPRMKRAIRMAHQLRGTYVVPDKK